MNKKIRAVGAAALALVWLGLTGFAWLSPEKETSDAERRPLAQAPMLSVGTLLSGKFMANFEDYTLDQFPARDTFRSLKSLFHTYALGQKDNNGIYIASGYAAKLEYPLNQASANYAVNKLNEIYKLYLQNSNVYMAIVPDKGYYLAQPNGYPAMDYEKLFATFRESLPWATHIDITGSLGIDSYYRTDTHWRQEKLIPVAQKLAQAMGVSVADENAYAATQLDRPFYGVYYGQAALPMQPETMYLLENPLLAGCKVYNHETGEYGKVYDLGKLTGKDLYDVFLSGPQALLTLENPNAKTDRELIIFRDSFGSSLAPLLVQDYKRITLVDIRYVSSAKLGDYLTFADQDVLLLYSTLVLNNSYSLK